MVSDNGPAFRSVEFAKFLKLNGVELLTTASYTPSSNGAAENAVKQVKLSLKKEFLSKPNVDVNFVLNNFLFVHRNTPHLTTQVPPSFLMFGRNLRTHFDLLRPSENKNSAGIENTVVKNQIRQKNYFKGHRKVEFKVGEEVLVQDFRELKSKQFIKGIIREKLGNKMFRCEIPELRMFWRRHIDQIRKWKSYYHKGIPQDILVQDNFSEIPDLTNPINITDDDDDDSVNNDVIEVPNVEPGPRPKRKVTQPDRLKYY